MEEAISNSKEAIELFIETLNNTMKKFRMKKMILNIISA
ncbi:MAG: type II toxin-antitoxin system HicB family antitoxin [Bacteroidota bacterium]|nr:type II toxin-antitoxin system HicB family antitoxin [Bacteroidota bacterium]